MPPAYWGPCSLPLGGDSEEPDVFEVPCGDTPPAPARVDVLEAGTDDLRVGVIRGLFSQEDIRLVHGIAQEPTVEEIHDRDDDLDYRHRVWRFEHELKLIGRHVYDRLMDAARAVDAELWNNLEEGDEVFPEIEYIVYDVKDLGEPGKINPHRDNQSKVSAVVLLSPPEDFTGGVNWFESGDNGEPDRGVVLAQGDAVFFYGDQCSHWITPVTSGRRCILQIELSEGWPACPPIFGGWLDWLL